MSISVPVLPELVVGELPPGTHALVMTHDHAEDAALCDAAIRNEQLATIGLIGSRAKWARFRRKLAEDGNSDGGDRPDHHADRTPRSARQGAGRHRGQRRGLAPAAILRRAASRVGPICRASPRAGSA